MTPSPMDKTFVAKRDFFQRNNPHHGSFHTKLSPSRSHDLLHLKSTYGHSQLKAFPSSYDGLDESYGGSPNSTRLLNRTTEGNDGGMYQTVKQVGVNLYSSPLVENTVKGKCHNYIHV